MVYFATPSGLRFAEHCFRRVYAQNNRTTIAPAGGNCGSHPVWRAFAGQEHSLGIVGLIEVG